MTSAPAAGFRIYLSTITHGAASIPNHPGQHRHTHSQSPYAAAASSARRVHHSAQCRHRAPDAATQMPYTTLAWAEIIERKMTSNRDRSRQFLAIRSAISLAWEHEDLGDALMLARSLVRTSGSGPCSGMQLCLRAMLLSLRVPRLCSVACPVRPGLPDCAQSQTPIVMPNLCHSPRRIYAYALAERRPFPNPCPSRSSWIRHWH